MSNDLPREQTILDYVTREYADTLGGSPIDANSPLISSGLIDSLSMVSLKVFLEQSYALRIPDTEATTESFDTVQAIVKMLRRLGVG